MVMMGVLLLVGSGYREESDLLEFISYYNWCWIEVNLFGNKIVLMITECNYKNEINDTHLHHFLSQKYFY